MVTILRGNIIHTPAFGKLETLAGGYLVLEDGVIAGVYPRLPEGYAACPVEDWGEKLILPSFADLHLHAPQYPMLGMTRTMPDGSTAALRRNWSRAAPPGWPCSPPSTRTPR